MPIAGMSGIKGPHDTFPGKSTLNMMVFRHIRGIIIVDKFMISNLPIHGKGSHHEKTAGQKFDQGYLDSVSDS